MTRFRPVGRSSGDLYQKKSLGQVFLKTDWPVMRMVERLVEWRVDRVIEIGPGQGILTKALLKAGMRVTAVEKDQRFAERMQDMQALIPAEVSSRFEVVNEDILQYDWQAWLARDAGARSAVVGNIPYNISSPIVLRGLSHLSQLKGLLFMTQLEFAARIAARPDTKDYGSLSVFTQLRGEPHLEFKVPRGCFHPVPKVDSAVISILPKRDPLADEILNRAEQVTRVAFMQRRKKLRNSVRQFFDGHSGKDAASLEAACPIDLDRRADSLSPRDFVLLAEYLLRPH